MFLSTLIATTPLLFVPSQGATSVPPRAALAPQFQPCAPKPLSAVQWRSAQPLSTAAGCGASAWPYGLRYSPDGQRLYVSLFGGFIGTGGCRVQRLDPQSFALLAEIPTGESPQDLAFVTHPGGAMRLGFVANSSGSSVTVFDEFDTVVATVPIPFTPGSFFPTAFPASLVVNPSQSHVWVSTQDGSGRVLAIDVATAQIDPARSIQLGPDHTAVRMAFAGSQLVIAASEALPNWIGSTAKVMAVDPAHPLFVRELALGTASDGMHFPSVQDLAVDCDGTVWAAGYDLGPRVFAIEPRSLTLRGWLPTQTTQPDGKFVALGLSREGRLGVADAWTSEIAFLDTRRHVWLATLDTASLPSTQQGTQELEFAPDGRTLLVTFGATNNLGVFDL